jgi:predicted phosphoribosyltransferase
MGNLHILSYESKPFSSRVEAGKLLADKIKNIVSAKSIVLGIPRGGIIVANEIAKKLKLQLDIVLSRKIGAPLNPEFAIGAVSEDGNIFTDEDILRREKINKDYIERESKFQIQEIQRRIKKYRQVKEKISLKDKTVIITDDGVATGATMQAAAWSAQGDKPNKIIVALPVGPEDTLKRLKDSVDEVICLRVPDFFSAVGQFYADFPQIEDEEVLALLSGE